MHQTNKCKMPVGPKKLHTHQVIDYILGLPRKGLFSKTFHVSDFSGRFGHSKDHEEKISSLAHL